MGVLKTLFVFLVGLTLLMGCNTAKTLHFYSPSKDQCISIIIDENIRYIINGYHNSVPDNDFVKIDISKIDRDFGDEIVGCWIEMI